MGTVGRVFLFALTAALNPTLVAATTVMLLIERPARMMLGYLAGALMTSLTLGMVIFFSLEGSGTATTTQHTLSPAADLALGGLAVVCGVVLARPRKPPSPRRQARAQKKAEKGPPRWQRALNRGSARTTFLVGAALTLPGASYLAGLTALNDLHKSTAVDVVTIIAFNLVMLALLEVPLLCFAIAPRWTPDALDRTKRAIGRHGRRYASRGLLAVGVALLIKGTVGLVAG